jgi:SPP1 family predicted phage head-tail adaptor
MNPGKLDIYGYIEYPTGTKNKGGETVKDWKVLTPVWLQRVSKSGSEPVAADQIEGIITDIFKLRYDSHITQKMRLIISGVVYQILSVNYGDRIYMTIETEKHDNEVYAT